MELSTLLERICNKPETYTIEDDPFDSFLKKHNMLQNPFSDKILNERMFVNKDAEACNRILRAVRHNQSSIVFLIGPTGSGKSEDADFIIRNLPEDFLFWYNQVHGQSSAQLAISIIKDIDPDFIESLDELNREMILDIYTRVLEALIRENKRLFCIFDQGEHLSEEEFELIINSTNPHSAANRAFSAIILAVPRFEKTLEEWKTKYDTGIKRALLMEHTRPFTEEQSLEYIIRALACAKNTSHVKLAKEKRFEPFTEEAITTLIELGEGHPATLSNLCYLSEEIAARTSPEATITPEMVKEAWNRYTGKDVHRAAVKWYKEKNLYEE
jgi:AAA+ ATPase superfamily predicted ATPase